MGFEVTGQRFGYDRAGDTVIQKQGNDEYGDRFNQESLTDSYGRSKTNTNIFNTDGSRINQESIDPGNGLVYNTTVKTDAYGRSVVQKNILQKDQGQNYNQEMNTGNCCDRNYGGYEYGGGRFSEYGQGGYDNFNREDCNNRGFDRGYDNFDRGNYGRRDYRGYNQINNCFGQESNDETVNTMRKIGMGLNLARMFGGMFGGNRNNYR